MKGTHQTSIRDVSFSLRAYRSNPLKKRPTLSISTFLPPEPCLSPEFQLVWDFFGSDLVIQRARLKEESQSVAEAIVSILRGRAEDESALCFFLPALDGILFGRSGTLLLKMTWVRSLNSGYGRGTICGLWTGWEGLFLIWNIYRVDI